ncbi:MAG: four helix bundle protein [Vicinamibacterales bacterium]
MGASTLTPGRSKHASFHELIIWQLGGKIRQHVFALTKKHPVAADFTLRSQLDDAAESVCRNIAERFACKSDRESAKCGRIVRRSRQPRTDQRKEPCTDRRRA